MRPRWLDAPAAAAFVLPFVLYLRTLAPTVYNLDSAEFSAAAATGGLVRATGYPLYLMVGRVWALLPLGDVGFRLNLMSAFFGALTVFLADRVLRWLRVPGPARLGGVGLLATAPFFWAMSLVAEVYALHTALMAAIVLLLLHWRAAPSTGRLALAAGAVALGLGNHAATVLLVPGCAWFVLATAPRQAVRPRALAAVGGAVVLGLAVYLWLPFRFLADPDINNVGSYLADGTFVALDLRRPENLWWLVTGRSFGVLLGAYEGSALWAEVGRFAGGLVRSFLAVGVGPGVVGAVSLVRRDRALGVALVLMFLANVAFYVHYGAVDKETMFLPAYLVWGLWVGVGGHVMLRWAAPQGRWPVWAAPAACVLAAVALSWNQVDLSGDRSARRLGERTLRTVERDAVLVGYWSTVPVLQYLQEVEGRRPDVDVVPRFLISDADLVSLVRREVDDRPVYLDALPAGLPPDIRTERAGTFLRLRDIDDPALDAGPPGT